MSNIVAYKIKNRKTGLYRLAGGGWSARGKTWSSLGALKASLVQEGFWGGRHGDRELPADDIVIIEVVIKEDEANAIDFQEFVLRERRIGELKKKYGEVFSTLVRRIEDQKQNDKWRWVMIAKDRWDYSAQDFTGPYKEMLKAVKDLKLKQNVDYKKSSVYSWGGVIAFANKQTAMRVRLMTSGQVTGVDIMKYIETALDNDDQDTV